MGAAASLYFIVTFFILAVLRMNFPFDLEWVEGAMVDQVRRVLAGRPMYTGPSLDHVPFPYTPLYIYLGALFSKILGIGYLPLRLINVLSTAGCLLVLFLFVRRETGKRSYGLLAAGLFAATYRLNAYWFDLARVDMLFLALIAVSAYLVRFGKGARALFAAGILAVLAFFSKQTALGPILALALYVFLFRRALAWWFVGTVLGGIGIGLVILDAATGGWFLFYTFTVPGNHGVIWSRFRTFWINDLLHPISPMLIASLFYLLACRRIRLPEVFWFAFLFCGSLFSAAFLSRMKVGGACNVLIPLHFGLALLSGLAFGCLSERENDKENDRFPAALRPFFLFLILLQFVLGLYDPARFLPPERAVRDGKAALKTLSKIPGNVWVMRYNNLSSRLGKGSGVHVSIVKDIVKVENDDHPFRKKFLDPIREKRYGAVVVDEKAIPKFIRQDLSSHYSRSDGFIRMLRWQTLSGWEITKENIYLPKP